MTELSVADALIALADEAARACTEPRRFHENEDNRQQALSQAVAAARGALRDATDDEYERGYIEGLGAYAYSSSEPWAENGVQYVGTTGTTLKQAVERFRAERR